MCSMGMGSGATILNAQQSLARSRQEDVGEMLSSSRASIESLGLNLNYAIKQMCSVGHGQLFISHMSRLLLHPMASN